MSEMENMLSELTAIESENVDRSQEEEILTDLGAGSSREEERRSDPDKKVDSETNTINLPRSGDLCTLDEESVMTDNFNPDCSWRNDSQLELFDEDDDESDTDTSDFEDYDTTDSESEEAAAEWLRQYYLRQKGIPSALAQLPDTIRISRVEETEEEREERERRSQERREEALRKIAAQPLQPTGAKGKRKFGDRMELEEASRDDFDNGQDYVDFLNGKLKNVSIKVTK